MALTGSKNASITQSEFRSKTFKTDFANSTEDMHTNLVGLDKSFYTILSESFGNKKNSGYSLLGLDLEISTKTHLL